MIRLDINHILDFSRSSLPSKYLGVPLVDNALKNNTWEDAISSLEKCHNS